jgi:ribosomal 30S subunit maturation factor RimM
LEDGISIGTVESVNPSKRTLRLHVIKSYGVNLPNLEWVKGKLTNGEPFRYRVARVEGKASEWTLTLVPGVPRNTCAGLKKATLVFPEADLVRSETEFELDELTGLEMVTDEQHRIGEITGTMDTNAGGVLEVSQQDGASLLIPALDTIIRRVDWKAGRVEVNDITPFAVHHDSDDDSAIC